MSTVFPRHKFGVAPHPWSTTRLEHCSLVRSRTPVFCASDFYLHVDTVETPIIICCNSMVTIVLQRVHLTGSVLSRWSIALTKIRMVCFQSECLSKTSQHTTTWAFDRQIGMVVVLSREPVWFVLWNFLRPDTAVSTVSHGRTRTARPSRLRRITRSVTTSASFHAA